MKKMILAVILVLLAETVGHAYYWQVPQCEDLLWWNWFWWNCHGWW